MTNIDGLGVLLAGTAIFVIIVVKYCARFTFPWPLALFSAIEILTVWPSLFAARSTIGPMPAILAATGLLLSVAAFASVANMIDLRHYRAPHQPSPTFMRSVRMALWLLASLLTLLSVYIFRGPPPLIEGIDALLSPSSSDQSVELLRETRRDLTKGRLSGQGSAGQGVFNLIVVRGWQIAVVLAAVHWSWVRSRRAALGLALVALLAFLFLGSLGSRMNLLLTVMAVAISMALRYRLRLRHAVVLGVAALALALLIVPLSKGLAGQDSVSERTSLLSSRLVEGNGQNNVAIVRLVSVGSLDVRPGDLFVERTLEMIPGVTASETPFALRLTRLAYGGGAGVTGYATPTQYGLIYADLGPIGVPIGYILSGFVLGLVWRRCSRFSGPMAPALSGLVATYLGYMSVGGIHGVVASVGLMGVLLVLVSGRRLLVGGHGATPAQLRPDSNHAPRAGRVQRSR